MKLSKRILVPVAVIAVIGIAGAGIYKRVASAKAATTDAAGDSTKAYRLLAATMEESGRAGIATFVMRGKEYLVAITAENGILRAETLRFADEVRSPADVGLPEVQKPKPAAVQKFTKAIKRQPAIVDRC